MYSLKAIVFHSPCRNGMRSTKTTIARRRKMPSPRKSTCIECTMAIWALWKLQSNQARSCAPLTRTVIRQHSRTHRHTVVHNTTFIFETFCITGIFVFQNEVLYALKEHVGLERMCNTMKLVCHKSDHIVFALKECVCLDWHRLTKFLFSRMNGHPCMQSCMLIGYRLVFGNLDGSVHSRTALSQITWMGWKYCAHMANL